MSTPTAWAWVETAPCLACDWTGFHWHWGDRRFRSTKELRPEEVIPFDEALGYPHPPGRITTDGPLP